MLTKASSIHPIEAVDDLTNFRARVADPDAKDGFKELADAEVRKNLKSSTLSDRRKEVWEASKELGKVVRFEIFLYNPHDGESIWVDNLRLSSVKEPPAVPAKTTLLPAP